MAQSALPRGYLVSTSRASISFALEYEGGRLDVGVERLGGVAELCVDAVEQVHRCIEHDEIGGCDASLHQLRIRGSHLRALALHEQEREIGDGAAIRPAAG